MGDQIRDKGGRVVGTYGFYVDLTREEQARQEQMTVDEATAFELLKWRSQETNVKLVQLAGQIVADFAAVQHNGEMAQTTYDNLFLTGQTRAAQATS